MKKNVSKLKNNSLVFVLLSVSALLFLIAVVPFVSKYVKYGNLQTQVASLPEFENTYDVKDPTSFNLSAEPYQTLETIYEYRTYWSPFPPCSKLVEDGLYSQKQASMAIYSDDFWKIFWYAKVDNQNPSRGDIAELTFYGPFKLKGVGAPTFDEFSKQVDIMKGRASIFGLLGASESAKKCARK